ncbi:MAG: hypothetical protein AABW54_01495 [Candidatus Micrarchaeota archaeon]
MTYELEPNAVGKRRLTELKRVFAPAYDKAIAPIVAGTAEHAGGRPRVLIIGAPYSFPKTLAMEVRRLLNEKGMNAQLVERNSDAVFWEKRDGELSRPFDAIVGDSIITHCGPKGVGEIFDKTKRLLKEGGTFIHVNDRIPDPYAWADAKKVASTGMLVGTGGVSATPANAEACKQAFERALKAAQYYTREEKLSFAAIKVGRTATVRGLPDSEKLGKSYANLLAHRHGIVTARVSTRVPDGHRRVTYQAIVTLSRKGNASALANHLQSNGWLSAR